MNCQSCEFSKCCKAFYFQTMRDGKRDYLPDYLVDSWWREVSFPLPEKFPVGVTRRMCMLQTVDGKCLIYEDRPSLCRSFSCDGG